MFKKYKEASLVSYHQELDQELKIHSVGWGDVDFSESHRQNVPRKWARTSKDIAKMLLRTVLGMSME